MSTAVCGRRIRRMPRIRAGTLSTGGRHSNSQTWLKHTGMSVLLLHSRRTILRRLQHCWRKSFDISGAMRCETGRSTHIRASSRVTCGASVENAALRESYSKFRGRISIEGIDKAHESFGIDFFPVYAPSPCSSSRTGEYWIADFHWLPKRHDHRQSISASPLIRGA